jgi:putative hydrolase of the HAD superfamily
MPSDSTPGAAGLRPMPLHALAETETWVFDLDNTLYPAESNLFPQVSLRMRRFIAERFGLSDEDARALQKRYFEEYGTTLRGLMVCHGQDPMTFLEYVHAIDVTVVTANPALDAALARLPGRKVIFTNASRGHAERVMDRLGVAHHFAGVFDIADAVWRPKPTPEIYDSMLARFAIDPASAVMVEDIARNLVPAAQRGMTTVWVRNDTAFGSQESEGDHVHHVADDLVAWLEDIGRAGGDVPP